MDKRKLEGIVNELITAKDRRTVELVVEMCGNLMESCKDRLTSISKDELEKVQGEIKGYETVIKKMTFILGEKR